MNSFTHTFNLCLLVISFSTTLFSQSSYVDDQVIFFFDDNLSEIEIIETLEMEYNFEIVEGPLVSYNAVLAQPINGNYLPEHTNNVVGPVNGVIADGNSKPSVNGIGKNFRTSNDPIPQIPTSSGEVSCQSINDNTLYQSHNVKVATFDTGITVNPIFGDHMDLSNPISFGQNYISPELPPIDDNGHGTQMSSIIINACAEINITNIELTTYKTHDAFGEGELWNVIKAMDDAIQQDIQIVNMSFSYAAPHDHKYQRKTVFSTILDYAKDANILCITAAGNNMNDNDNGDLLFYPASFENENIISVAGLNCDLGLASWSNWGLRSIDIAAPGESIRALNMNGNYEFIDGTSAATAKVTALAANLASYTQVPNYADLKCAILKGSTKSNQLIDFISSGSYINPANAVNVMSTSEVCGFESLNSPIRLRNSTEKNETKIKHSIFNDYLSLETNNGHREVAQIVITNSIGQVFLNKEFSIEKGFNHFRFPLPESIAHNIYFIQIVIGEKVETIKFVK